MANYRSKIRLAFCQHDYQPFGQIKHWVDVITAERYRPFYDWASQYDGFAGTVNINFSLLELLAKFGHGSVIDMMRTAVERGSVELLDTVAYHCILPLATEDEICRSVELDRAGKRQFGFPELPRRGFYLPEYAYSKEAAAVLKKLGYEFTIADDEMFHKMHGGPTPFDRVITDESGLHVFLRSRDWGNRIKECANDGFDFDRLRAEFPPSADSWFGGRRGYAVFATDGETFGHHQKGMIQRLVIPMLQNWDARRDAEVNVVSFEALLNEFGAVADRKFVPPSTWSTSHKDMTEGQPFPLWDAKDNVWHQAFWKMANIMRSIPDVPELWVDRIKALTSCGPWWVSKHATEFCPRLMMPNIDIMMSVIERSGNPDIIAAGRATLQEIERLPGFHR